MADKAKKSQRIKMRIYKHPVKHDGTIIEFAPDGSSFKVEFDGPLPVTTFYKYHDNNTLVLTKPTDNGGMVPAGCQIWEVL